MKFETGGIYQSTLLGKIARRLLLVISLLLILGILLTLIIQIPAVQNYVRKKTVSYLQTKIGHPVRIGRVKLDRLSNLGLDHFYIEGAHQDTVMYAGHASVSIDMSIIDVLQGKVSIHDIALEHLTVNNVLHTGDSLSSLDLVLRKLFPPRTTERPDSRIELDLKNIALQDIRYLAQSAGSATSLYLASGLIEVNQLQLDKKIYDFKGIRLDRPIISFYQKTLKANQATPNEVGGLYPLTDTTRVLYIDQLDIINGTFSMQGPPPTSNLDTWLKNIQDIQVGLDNLKLEKGQLKMGVRQLQVVNSENQGIHDFKASHIVVSDKSIQLIDFDLKTVSSRIADTIVLSYNSFDDFNRFEDLVGMDLRLDNSILSLNELMYFFPGLQKNAFLKSHQQEHLSIDGRISGSLNDLKSGGIKLSLGQGIQFVGKIEAINLTKPEELFLTLRINNLAASSTILKEIVQGLGRLKNFERLGTIRFRGNFDGSFKDFVAYGILNTDLGASKLDMRLNTKNGLDRARYSGEIELNDFDLQRWSGVEALGKVSLKAIVTEGIGLEANNASAKLQATIKKLEYKGYTYSNAVYQGQLNQKLLDGSLVINDPHADLDFNGKLDFTQQIPSYDFVARVRQLDLAMLNLTKFPLKLSGDVDLAIQGRRIEELIGRVNLSNIKIVKDSQLVVLKSLHLEASSLGSDIQKMVIQSDWLDGEIKGTYTIKEIWPSLKNQLMSQFPEFVTSFNLNKGVKVKVDTTTKQNYQFNFQVKDINAISTLINQKISAQNPFRIEGAIQDRGKYVLANWNIPDLQINDLKLYNSVGRFEAKGAIAYTSSYTDSTTKGDFHMPHMVLTADLSSNKMNFSITTPKVTNLVNNVALNGTMRLVDSTWYLQFATSQVSFLDRKWDILPNNEIVFRPGFLQTKNLRFVNGNEKIEFTSVNNQGLKVDINQLDIGFANHLLKLRGWILKGKLNLNAEVDNLFALKGLKVSGQVDSLMINDSFFGLLDLNAHTPNLDQPINMSMALLDGNNQLMGEGFYDVSGKFSGGNKNNYQFKFLFKDYPLRIFEFLIDDIIDNTQGTIIGSLLIKKINDKADFAGKIQIKNGSLKINYLGTNYQIGNQPVQISNGKIDATGVSLKDELGNTASITGGFLHDRFGAFRINAGISSNRFLVLKTTKDENPDYYGTMIGNIVAKFVGPFNRIDIDVKGTTARPTELNIPISQATVTTKDRIVQYRPKVQNTAGESIKPKRILAAKGISVGIDLTINDNAEIALIFDEKLGDILKGRGNGDIQMRFDRNGEMTMFGNYEVVQGEYLFTLLRVFNKPFAIKQGGTIRWDGDPLGAEISLDAEYKGLTSSLINLLPEYENSLQSSELRAQSSVDLSMHLFGELAKPEISFNLEIPNLTGNLRSAVDSKLSLLKSDQNALNQQILGLMVWGSFLPPNQLVASSGVIGSTINNLSQFLSSQLSLLVENALKELVADNDVISGFDFDVNYYNNNNAIDINNVSVFDELNINLGPKFFQDRLSVGVGANFVNSTLFDRLITPHFEVEYSLTKDRRLKIKAYARKDDISQGQLKDRIGGGISWRKEFDSISDFKRQLKEDLDRRAGAAQSLQ